MSRPQEFPFGYALWYINQRLRKTMRIDQPPKAPGFKYSSKSFDADYFQNRKSPAFYAATVEAEQLSADSLSLWKRQLMNDARLALNHQFDFGGFGPIDLGDEIDWLRDPYASDCESEHRGSHPDLRIIWELNRCSHFPVLGLTYAISGDDIYSKEIVRQMRQWVSGNPGWAGPNWESSMEASIRIFNWIWAFMLIRRSAYFDDEFVGEFLAQVAIHGDFIYRNLERSATSNNHYLAGGVGLLHLGLLFPEFKDRDRWLRTGKHVTFSEIINQTYKDGAGFEGSISYHGLALEMVLPTIILCRSNGVDIPALVMQRIERMLEFVAAYTRDDGTYPQLGDRDDGHLLKVSPRLTDSHTQLLTLGAAIFERGDFKACSDGWGLEAQLYLGERGRSVYDRLPVSGKDTPSGAFSDSGYFFMRHDGSHMAIDCADVGLKGRGGHGHNDCLGIELHAFDRRILIDSGSYQYAVAEEVRRSYQGTAAHNTVTVDEQEIARFIPGNIWGITDEAKPVPLFWHSDKDYDVFEGAHYGYQRLTDPVTHTRRIIFDKAGKFWVIRDTFSGSEIHDFAFYFHFAPEYLGSVSRIGGVPGVRAVDTAGFGLVLLPLTPGEFAVSINECLISQRYGHAEAAPVVRITAAEGCPWSFEMCLWLIDASRAELCPDKIRAAAIEASCDWGTTRHAVDAREQSNGG
jgi:hypothetical protein